MRSSRTFTFASLAAEGSLPQAAIPSRPQKPQRNLGFFCFGGVEKNGTLMTLMTRIKQMGADLLTKSFSYI